MALIKHNKIKNSGILFEILVRKITSDTLSGADSKAIPLLKKYFVNTELGKEYKLYEIVFKQKSLTEGKANTILETALNSSKYINRTKLKNEKYNLIKELKELYDLDSLFKIKLESYKRYAAFSNLLESQHNPIDKLNIQNVIDNKITVLEYLTDNAVNPENTKSALLEEFKSFDKDTRILTHRILLEKFNDKYKNLSQNQKTILREYINNIESTTNLKDFYNKEINSLKESILKQIPTTKNKSTKIKLEEISKMMVVLDKKSPMKNDNLVDLLQYHSLVEELVKANG